MRLIQSASYLMPWSTSLRALAHHSYLWTSQEPIAASTSTPVYKVSNKRKTGCPQIGLIQNRWRHRGQPPRLRSDAHHWPRIWGPPRSDAIRTLKRLRELEVDFVDTADSYGPEISERLRALYPHDGILIATKAGLTRPGPGEWQRDGPLDRLRQQAIKSRDRLGLEQIGLWQLHSIDPKRAAR